MLTINTAYLKELPVFRQIPEEHLQWLLDNSEIHDLKTGEFLFKKGDTADYMYLILDGQLDISMDQNGKYKFLFSMKKGEITGLLPFSRLKTAGGNGIAHVPTTVLSLHRKHFPEMDRISPEMVQELVALMTDRVREFTRTQQQNEKLVALGRLSAGLAHELNNPAAAIVRSSAELLRIHHTVPEKFKRVITMRVLPEQVDQVNAILFEKINNGLRTDLSLLERNNLEEEITTWLEEKNVEEGYLLSETFVESGLTLADLEAINTILDGKHLPEFLDWIANTLNTEKVICDIQAASKKISELVKAVKTYSHMDRGQEKEKTNIQSGIASTLTMLNHKLKTKNIQVVQNFAEDLPPISAFVGELNQVWTNLIDNAIDAMPDGGTLTITAEPSGEMVKVSIADTGQGIPAEAIDRIFEPFFTTKPIGKGTGLGLDIVNKIIMHHNADIKVKSEPGQTVFTLCFPIE